MKRLNIIGCGAVGKTLGRLFREAGVFTVGDIVNRTLASASQAASFVGAGRPLADMAAMGPADLYLVAASDRSLAACAEALARSGNLGAGSVVWQVSGALPSEVLAPVRARGAQVASVHPVKSFADPAASVADFAGTWCGIEGDAGAVEQLGAAMTAIGGRLFAVDPRFKSVYHAGAVLSCNYLTALVEVGAMAYEKGGLSRETALKVMEPLVRGTVDNVFRAGTAKALTGPIARGDLPVVEAQLEALDRWDREVATLYRLLGRYAVRLSRRKGVAAEDDLKRIELLLEGKGELPG